MTLTLIRTISHAAGLALVFLAGAAEVVAAQPAAAQETRMVCSARDSMLAKLARTYGEVPVAIGVTNGALVELLTAEDGVTWTLIMTSPQGISCLIAAGEGWRPLDRAPADPAV